MPRMSYADFDEEDKIKRQKQIQLAQERGKSISEKRPI